MTKAKTILVTGAMGQLGKRVTGILLQRGHHVLALDLRNEATQAVAEELASQPGRLQPAYVNLLDAEGLRALLAECPPEAVIHLAALVAPPCYRDVELARRVNVDGTRHLVEAAAALDRPPLFVFASSSSVYGSRNPHRHPERVTADTPVNPVDCYGEHKVEGEKLVAGSGMPYAILRLGGIISPDSMETVGPEYLLFLRATPWNNRLHAVDARDAALAFANAAEREAAVNGRILLIGGDDSCAQLQGEVQDSIMQALGIGRLGPSAGLPGDPDDEFGWALTDWFDTSEAQALLDFQQHSWADTLAWLRASQGRKRIVVRLLGPLIRVLMRGYLKRQRKREGRGTYANPWALVSGEYGTQILAASRRKPQG